MNILHTVILSLVQGIAEFLPISSSGHLILVPSLFGWDIQSLAFDTVLHLGTAAALIVYFWRDLLSVLRKRKLFLLLLVGSVPAGLLGFFLEDFIAHTFREPFWVAIFLSVGTLLMILAEKTYAKVWSVERISNWDAISFTKSWWMGLFQSLALFSGVSRSGATISGGMFLGLTRELAARFSFLLSIPIVLGAGLYEIFNSAAQLSFDVNLLMGFFISFFTGLLAIKYLLNYLKKHNLKIFIWYRIILCLVIIFALI